MNIIELKALLEIKNWDAFILKISAFAEIFVSISGEKVIKCSKQLKLLRFAPDLFYRDGAHSLFFDYFAHIVGFFHFRKPYHKLLVSKTQVRRIAEI